MLLSKGFSRSTTTTVSFFMPSEGAERRNSDPVWRTDGGPP